MALYDSLVLSNSPLFTYHPPVGFDSAATWVTNYTNIGTIYYQTSAPSASVSFDFYGDEFALIGPIENTCSFNVSVNGVLQTPLFHGQAYDLPVGEHHVEMDVFCSPGQVFGYEGVIFAETQGPPSFSDDTYYLSESQIRSVGQWDKQYVYSQYFLMNFTQYMTHTPGSTLEYSFIGEKTEIVGPVAPDGSDFFVTLDGKKGKTYSTYNPVQGDDVTLWLAQLLEPDKTHVVTLTNLGQNLTVLNINYDVLVPAGQEA